MNKTNIIYNNNQGLNDKDMTTSLSKNSWFDAELEKKFFFIRTMVLRLNALRKECSLLEKD